MDLAGQASGAVGGDASMIAKDAASWRYVVTIMGMTQLIACSTADSRGTQDNYWPGSSWRTSTPEAQGMDSGTLLELFAYVADADIRLHHLSIIRNGYLVLNADFYPYLQDWPHDIVSVTKSVTSTLIGIAHREGLLDLDSRVLSHFPEVAANQVDPLLHELTVRHLLTMTSGLCEGSADNAQQLDAMRRSPSGADVLLHEPLRSEPGNSFAYCDGASQLLSAILTRVTRMPAREYAHNRLFEPLGIDGVIWPRDPRGDNSGWGDSFIRPLDLGRIGYLYLRDGIWSGKRILSEDWLRHATTGHVATPGGERYGYHWWVPQDGMYEARGRGGQRLIVWPKHDLVIVMFGAGFDPADIGRFIVAALHDADSMPENPETHGHLQRRLAAAAAAPEAHPVRPSPDMADSVSGRTYHFEANAAGLEWFRLTFDRDGEGRIDLSLGDQYHERRGLRSSTMGLDGLFRISPTGRFGLPVAALGYWSDPSTFEVIYDEIANTHLYDIRLEFDGRSARWQMRDRTAPFSVTLLAHSRAQK
jgi:CubicO group peptidase (beta-lactamase class C family)